MLNARIHRTSLLVTALIGLTAVSALLWAATAWASDPVTLSDLPDAHGGNEFDFTLTYNGDHPTSYRDVPGEVTVDGGSVTNVARSHTTPEERNYVWAVTVTPNDEHTDVTIEVQGVTATVPADTG